MSNSELFTFVQTLAKDLTAGEINLPSLPAVVMKIRSLLDDEDCDFEQVSKVVSVDSTLTSRLFVFANSAYHNRSGEKVPNLEGAIAKLGLELVRSTALALAIQQLTLARQQSDIAPLVREIWSRSIKLSSMSHALAAQHRNLNDETAFMCGLLHDVGKLYVLTKVSDFPELFTNAEPIGEVIGEWHSQIGRAIVEDWGFPEDVVESMDSGEFLDENTRRAPKMVDVVYVATMLIDHSGDGDELADVLTLPSCQKLGVSEETIPTIFAAYKEKYEVVQQVMI